MFQQHFGNPFDKVSEYLIQYPVVKDILSKRIDEYNKAQENKNSVKYFGEFNALLQQNQALQTVFLYNGSEKIFKKCLKDYTKQLHKMQSGEIMEIDSTLIN